MSPKSQHHKRTFKGSRSLFSGELWRSLGRRRSRSGMSCKKPSDRTNISEALDTSNTRNNLSSAPAFRCDPSHQVSSCGDTGIKHNSSSSFQTSASTSLRTLDLRSSIKSTSAVPDEISRRRKSRPLSWLSLTRHKSATPDPESPSIRFPEPSSMLSMPRSQISTPVLTSTTNARVADAENVEYSDVLLPDYSSRDAPSSDNIHNISDIHHIQYSIVRPSTWSSTVRSMKKKLTHRRRASTSVLLETPWSRRLAEMRDCDNVQGIHSPGTFHHLHSYKDVFHRGRHGLASSQCIVDEFTPTHGDLASLAFGSRNKSTPDFRLPPRLPGLYSESNADLVAPSLTKSFAIAVDKLDFNSSPTLISDDTPTWKLKKARSYLSLHRLVHEYSDRTFDKDDLVISSSPAIIPAKSKALQGSKDPSLLGRDGQDMYRPKIRASKPIQLRFSGQKKCYIPSKPDANSPSGVNPLRMHPEVSNAAGSSSQVTPSTPTFPEDVDGRPSGSINRAVIYSPSTGNLSVYSRTPSPFTQAVPKERVPQETPTKKPLHKASGSILRKSVSTLFGRSTSMMKIATSTSTKQRQPEKDGVGASRHRTTSDTRILDLRAVAEVRARSFSTPEIQHSESARAPWSHQPPTPSPLRKSMMVNTTRKGLQRAATSTTRVRPTAGVMLDKTRSNSVLSDPEKRYGMYIDQADAPTVFVC